MSRSVSVYDIAQLIAGTSNAVMPLGSISTVTSESLVGNVLDGKRTFFNASDPRMSRDGYLSCASCHLDGGSDGQQDQRGDEAFGEIVEPFEEQLECRLLAPYSRPVAEIDSAQHRAQEKVKRYSSRYDHCQRSEPDKKPVLIAD